MEPHSTPFALPGRRTVLAAGAALVVSGCSLDSGSGRESTKTPAAQAVRHLAPDVAIAVEAVVAIRSVQLALTRLAQRPGAASTVNRWLPMHQAHLDALMRAVPKDVDFSTAGAASTGRPATLAAVRRTESDLHDRLVAFALRAESGPFALLLGSMAAAISQRLAADGAEIAQ